MWSGERVSFFFFFGLYFELSRKKSDKILCLCTVLTIFFTFSVILIIVIKFTEVTFWSSHFFFVELIIRSIIEDWFFFSR